MTAVQLDSSQPLVSFGALLRQHRVRLGLTQAVLAERAGLSAHGIQKLERVATQPYRDTADRLSRALQLSEQDAARFKAAARRGLRRATRSSRAPWPPVSHSRSKRQLRAALQPETLR
jgi:transcriptional regulator with XRE-family HTH domain